MGILTDKQKLDLENLTNDPDLLGGIRSFPSARRTPIMDKRIKFALLRLIADEKAPHQFATIKLLFETLEKRGMNCHSLTTFRARIVDEDDRYFNSEIKGLAAILLPEGYLGLESKEKQSAATVEQWRPVVEKEREAIRAAAAELAPTFKAGASGVVKALNLINKDINVAATLKKLCPTSENYDEVVYDIVSPFFLDGYAKMDVAAKISAARRLGNGKNAVLQYALNCAIPAICK